MATDCGSTFIRDSVCGAPCGDAGPEEGSMAELEDAFPPGWLGVGLDACAIEGDWAWPGVEPFGDCGAAAPGSFDDAAGCEDAGVADACEAGDEAGVPEACAGELT